MRVLAVDLGATSARVAAVDLDAAPPTVDVVHRAAHAPVRAEDGSLRWDFDGLLDAVRQGIEGGLAVGPVASIGVDTWGVDYGLLDAAGNLLSAPHCYRGDRTAQWENVADRIGRERLYRTSGIQLMGINTVFQLAAHERRELDAASRLLMLPELVVHALTGAVTGEVTSAGTTGLVDVATGDWSKDVLDDIGVDPALMPPIAPAGTPVGHYRGVPVHLVGGHDTASAVAALPGAPQPRAAFVSTGTWLLVGAERPVADVSDAARTANFSNEPGVLGGVRFLKNVTGYWLLEQCRAQWGDPPVEELVKAAGAAPSGGPTIDPNDPRFTAPTDMEAELRTASGLADSAGRDQVVRCIIDSLAAATARVVDELGAFLGGPVSELHIIGGASRITLANDLMQEACGIPVRVGSPEATALGNALVQGIALGRFSDLPAARTAIAGP